MAFLTIIRRSAVLFAAALLLGGVLALLWQIAMVRVIVEPVPEMNETRSESLS